MRILYLLSSANLWGARKSLLDILRVIDRDRFSPFVIIPGKGAIEKEFKKLHIPYEIIHFAPWRKVNRVFQRKEALKKLKDFLEKESFDLIHANSHFVTPYAVSTGGRKGIPVITHIREIFSPDKISKYLLHKSNLIICNSLATKEPFQPLPPDKLRVIYNGIDAEYFSPQPQEEVKAWREKWGIGDVPVVGYIGKISYEKGVDLLLKVIPAVLKEVPEAKFLLAGEARRERDMDILTGLKNYGERVVLTGWVDELPLFYSSIDVLFFPTRKESFGRVAVEALSCETPVVASKVGGVQEIIDSGVNGFLFPLDDLVEGKDKLVYILKHREASLQVGRKGREKVKEKFELFKMVREIEQIYADF